MPAHVKPPVRVDRVTDAEIGAHYRKHRPLAWARVKDAAVRGVEPSWADLEIVDPTWQMPRKENVL